jgi:hypothetical protein
MTDDFIRRRDRPYRYAARISSRPRSAKMDRSRAGKDQAVGLAPCVRAVIAILIHRGLLCGGFKPQRREVSADPQGVMLATGLPRQR